ncbi:putative G-protein coupled receptor C06G4.5 [Aphelenchoides besseyi]|nr:putative G-protein coupled receptor C06G4.5 [Aphelenchoides besseyi]
MDGMNVNTMILTFFIPCFFCGVGGNVYVIVQLKRSWKQRTTYTQMNSYIFLLCIADLSVLLMSPVVVSYFILKTFVFGEVGCKLYFGIENINKLLSVAILVLMSIERFFVICRPFESGFCRSNRRSACSGLVAVLILFLIIVILCFPIIYYAEITEMVDLKLDGSLEHLGTLCISALPDEIMPIFIGYMFVLGFVLPGFIVFTCYFFLIRHLRRNNQRWSSSLSRYSTRVRSVVRSVLKVIVFHFVCWFGFWLFVIFPMISYLFNIDFIIRSKNFQIAHMIASFHIFGDEYPRRFYRAVIFDQGGVLLPFKREKDLEIFSNHLTQNAVDRQAYYDCENGITTFEDITEMLEMLFPGINQDMIRAAQLIKQAGLKIAILSNNYYWSHKRERTFMIDEADQFDLVVESCRVGMRKPNPKIYEVFTTLCSA